MSSTEILKDIDVLEDLHFIMKLRKLLKPNGESRNPKRNRKIRQRKSYKSNNLTSAEINNLMDENREEFSKSTSMSHEQFNILLSLLEPWLEKFSRRKPIEPKLRLYITLYFLAQGCSLNAISKKFRIGLETSRSIVLDTCSSLWTVLAGSYMSPPNSEQWQNISDRFLSTISLPNCLGALDGKHIRVTCPPNSSFNYRKHNTIILWATCDSNYAFTLVDVDASGIQDIGCVLENSDFGRNLIENELDIPEDAVLPASDIVCPYYFVVAETIPLRRNLLKPYSNVYNEKQEYFNEKISEARICIEVAFEILTARWQILRTSINSSSENAKKFVLATVLLHNFLRHHATNEEAMILDEYDEIGLTSVTENELSTEASAPTQDAFDSRNTLCDYLSSYN